MIGVQYLAQRHFDVMSAVENQTRVPQKIGSILFVKVNFCLHSVCLTIHVNIHFAQGKGLNSKDI